MLFTVQIDWTNLRNLECGKQLNTSWKGLNLTHCNLPVYLGITLDRTLSYKAHIEKTKKKVGTRNNIICKLRTSKWGATPTTLRSSALALCYSAAEYACSLAGIAPSDIRRAVKMGLCSYVVVESCDPQVCDIYAR